MNLIGSFFIIWTVLLIEDKIVNLWVNLKAFHFRAREILNRTNISMRIIR
jgi:hypothetical protein